MNVTRGEIVLAQIAFSDQSGSKKRPVVVVSNDRNNAAIDDVIVVSISTVTRPGALTHVAIDPAQPSGLGTGLLHPSFVQCENLFALDKGLILRRMGRVPNTKIVRCRCLPEDGAGLTLTTIATNMEEFTMSEHHATIRWKRSTPDFAYPTYNRGHTWDFDAGITVNASASPDYRGDTDRVDPEEAFVAALSSCHMLTFLALAANKKFVVDSYEDAAVGHLAKNENGKLAVTKVVLHPKIQFGGTAPSPEEMKALHDRAHHECFIANSVKAEVTVEPA